VTSLRRLSYAALALATLQIIFGAIVRITGSGMGCGDHWPTCHGELFPPLDRLDLVIEVTHRYIAVALVGTVVVLVVSALRRRHDPRIGGRGGVLQAASLAAALVVTAAVLGAVTVKLGLHPLAVVAHLAIAMALLATLVLAVVRSGGLGARRVAAGDASAKTVRGARVAAALAFTVLIMGALTANLPGAAPACQGFPLCDGAVVPRAGAQHVHVAHRVLAFLLCFHVLGLAISVGRRRESPVVGRASRIVLGVIVVQLTVAAALVELGLPPALQSLHQGVGTLVWVAVVAFAALAGRAAGRPAQAAGLPGTGARRAAPAPTPSYIVAPAEARRAES